MTQAKSVSYQNKKQNSDNPLFDADISWQNKATGNSEKADEAEAGKRGEEGKENQPIPTFDKSMMPPKSSIEWHKRQQEASKNTNHRIDVPAPITFENIKKANNNFTYIASDGKSITPSNDVLKFLEEYFNDEYNAVNTTFDVVINENMLDELHKYLSNGVKNAERPANIGKGLWAKQVDNDLKWIDDMFGKSSNFAKALKAIPVITIGIDTLRGVNENIKNDADVEETLSDAVIDIGLGALTTTVSSKVGVAIGTAIAPGIGTIAGIAVGLAIGFATEGISIKGKSAKEWLDVFADWAIDGVKSWFE